MRAFFGESRSKMVGHNEETVRPSRLKKRRLFGSERKKRAKRDFVC